MIEMPLPWTQDSVAKLKLLFNENTGAEKQIIALKWWWRPFHETGRSALVMAAEKKLSAPGLDAVVGRISVVGLPKHLGPPTAGLLRTAGALDEDERLLPLDPAPRIRATVEEAGGFATAVAAFASPKARLFSVAEFKDFMGPLSQKWAPEAGDDEPVLSKWLTVDHELVKRFQNLDAWSKLELIEALIGVAKSSSILHFQRIVG